MIERGQSRVFRGQQDVVKIDKPALEEGLRTIPPLEFLPLRERVMARVRFGVGRHEAGSVDIPE